VLSYAISQLRSDAGQRPALEYLRVLQLLELLLFLQSSLMLLNLLDSILNILQGAQHLLSVPQVLVDRFAGELHVQTLAFVLQKIEQGEDQAECQ